MHRITYTSSRAAQSISLDGDGVYVGTGGGLRSHEWTYSLTRRAVKGLSLGARTVEVSAYAEDAKANTLRRMADADAAAQVPGLLTVDGEWNMRCYIVEMSASKTYMEGVQLSLTIALIDECWWRVRLESFVTGYNEGGLDFPFDFPFDFNFKAGSGAVHNGSDMPAPAIITFYGPCTNPYVTIGGNRYEVDVQVATGHRVVIDFTGAAPTVMHYDQYGNGYSVFSEAVRDGGLGGGSYAFQPIPAGESAATWSGTFSWSVELREQDTEPLWAR